MSGACNGSAADTLAVMSSTSSLDREPSRRQIIDYLTHHQVTLASARLTSPPDGGVSVVLARLGKAERVLARTRASMKLPGQGSYQRDGGGALDWALEL